MNNKRLSLLMVVVLIFTVILPVVQPLTAFANDENLALGKPVFASGNEVDWLVPENAVDGDSNSRWSSAKEDDQWLYVDLGEEKTIAEVVIKWQTPAETYKILVSNDKEHWVNVMGNDEVLIGGDRGEADTIKFEEIDARYVKFQGIERRPVNDVYYGYSFYEFEVYERNILNEIVESIGEDDLVIHEGQEELILPEVPEGYKITLFGSDRLPVIDKEGHIYTPLVDAKVNLLFQVEEENNPENKAISDNVLVTVPGKYTQTDDLNKEPKVIPSLREWYGRTGDFILTESSRIVVDPADKDVLQKSAEITKRDLKAITNLDLDVEYGMPGAGDIFLSIDDSLASLGEEGYIFDVKDYVSITSVDITGVFYGTRTVLQILKQDEEHKHIPKGISRDYPKYKERGFMLDVARKFYTIDFLRDYVKLMAYYKMNRFQIHLNDHVGTPFPNGSRGAFRLESETYPGLTSTDGFYTKEEFRDLQRLGVDYGVNIVPEIDTPGHSRAFTEYDPSLGSGGYLDISRPETVDFVKSLFDEYIDGENPTFIGPDVHIGTDEYWGSDTEVFRAYMDTLIDHLNEKGKHPRLWGGLTEYDGDTPISNDATMDIWHEPYGGAQQAVDLGYDVVNVNNAYLYIVPRRDRDYLNSRLLYDEWEPNKWINSTLPYGHPNLKGGMFAFWNDISFAEGVSMADSHHRILPGMQVVSEKMWAGTREDKDYNQFTKTVSTLGDAPNANLSHEIEVENKDGNVITYDFEKDFKDSSGNGFDGTGKHVKLTEGMFGDGVRFNGGESYIETPLRSLGFGWTVSMWIKPDAHNPDDAVLMESPEGQLKLTQGDTGKLGFSKEGYDSFFDYEVPAGEWTHILLTGDSRGTSLYVNGSEYAERLKDGSTLETLVLPIEKIGSETNSFKGVIDNLMFFNTPVDYFPGNLALNKDVESSEIETPDFTPDQAVDGEKSRWSRWSSARVDDAWFLVDLGEPKEIDKVVIDWEPAYAKKYQILVSNDKEHWTNVIDENEGIVEGNGEREAINFDAITARYVKFQGVERATNYGYSFYEFEVYLEESPLPLGDKTVLKNRLYEINKENLNQIEFTQESWKELQKALEVTENTLNKLYATQSELDDSLATLNEARASLEEIPLSDAASIINRVLRFKQEGKFENESSARSLEVHLTAVNRYEEKELAEKVVKHMESFKMLLDHQQENEWISERAYNILKADAGALITKWE